MKVFGSTFSAHIAFPHGNSARMAVVRRLFRDCAALRRPCSGSGQAAGASEGLLGYALLVVSAILDKW